MIRKDKRIEFLEERVATLESVIALNSDVQSQLTDIIQENDKSGQQLELVQESLATNNSSDPEIANTQTSRWVVWLLPILGLLLVAFLAKNKLLKITKNLNLFGANDQIEFDDDIHQTKISEPITKKESRDFSVMSSSRNKDNEEGEIDVTEEEVSFISFNDSDSSEEANPKKQPQKELTQNESLISIPEDQDTVMDFQTRFSRLLEEKDFDFAKELLDFARHNEINEERYHCERLRLYQVKGNEDQFYEYYYKIESKIPMFSLEMQNRISELVVEIGQAHA